jgi:dihydrodipicolinate synthase/N-acetylneuraminate lyase
MGFWAWFAIWATLAVAALAFLIYIGYELFNKLEGNFHQLSKLQAKVEPLTKALESNSNAERPVESLLRPIETLAARKSLLRARANKAEDRQRRLIARLKDFNPQESRFRK